VASKGLRTGQRARWQPFRLAIIVGCVATSACQLLGGARITELATGTAKPGNVATFVSVTEKDKPVVGLPASAFKITENDQIVDADTAQLQLIEPARYATFHTVLLVDMSQAKDGSARKALAKAAAAFVRRVRLGQSVTVVAYDGSDKVRVVGDYAAEAHATTPEQVDALATLSLSDPSRNLRGAVLQGLEILDRRLAASQTAVQLGTLAVFARGPDLAGRTPEATLNDSLVSRTDKFVYIGVTGETPDSSKRRLSQSGEVTAQSGDTLPIAFEDAGALVDGLLDQYYLLSYCSPARAGTRDLKVTVSVPVPDGKDETDSFSVHFDATGFTAGCDSQKVPPLVATSKPKADGSKAPAASSSGRPAASSSANNDSAKASTKHSDDHEAPMPAKPGYAQ
jgi:hypothetical protein